VVERDAGRAAHAIIAVRLAVAAAHRDGLLGANRGGDLADAGDVGGVAQPRRLHAEEPRLADADRRQREATALLALAHLDGLAAVSVLELAHAGGGAATVVRVGLMVAATDGGEHVGADLGLGPAHAHGAAAAARAVAELLRAAATVVLACLHTTAAEVVDQIVDEVGVVTGASAEREGGQQERARGGGSGWGHGFTSSGLHRANPVPRARPARGHENCRKHAISWNISPESGGREAQKIEAATTSCYRRGRPRPLS
jgi:hypothetical protein